MQARIILDQASHGLIKMEREGYREKENRRYDPFPHISTAVRPSIPGFILVSGKERQRVLS